MQGGTQPPDADMQSGARRDPLSQDDAPSAADASPPPGADARKTPPPLDESLHRIVEDCRALAGSAWDTFRAFRALVLADLALSRSAAGRVLVLGVVATVLGVTAWLFGMALLVIVLRALALDWWLAVAIPTVLSLLGACLCAWLALRAFELTRFKATRRQLAQLGLGDDPDAVDRDPERLA